MKIEIRNNGITDVTVLVADDDKLIKRKGNDPMLWEELWLGKSYYINGELLETPHDDIPEDFEEVERPTDWGVFEELNEE